MTNEYADNIELIRISSSHNKSFSHRCMNCKRFETN